MPDARTALFCLVLLVAMDVRGDDHGVATRYGKIETRTLRGDTDRSEIRFHGKLVASVEGNADLYKLTSDAGPEFVLADAWVPGLHCHHQFTLVEIRANGTTARSPQFGECKTLRGARMQGGRPVVQLEEPTIEDSPARGRVHEFLFVAGSITELPDDTRSRR